MADSPEKSPPRKRGLWQWLWRSAELAEARQAVREVPSDRREQLQRAATARELAARCVDPVDPLRAGPSLPLALSLYREAAYWALAAQGEQAPADLADAFARTPADLLEFAAGSAEGVKRLQTALLTKGFRETALDQPEQQRTDAQAADAFVKALLDNQLGAEQRVGRALVQRSVRGVLALVLLCGLGFGAVSLVTSLTTKPDLAAGKPWRASSQNQGVPSASRGEYLFHTTDEDEPWFEVDLRKPTEFSLVEVMNRRDCCPDRAVPAVIEVSRDKQTWKEVSRRKETFSVWKARFAPVTARYVRVRVLRRSILHLAGVAVRVQ
jgi:hypothetical protein